LVPSQPSPASTSDQHLPDTPDTVDNSVSCYSLNDTADWVADLQLMHHFITVASNTLFQPDMTSPYGDIWQVHMPKLAFVHHFLLHQILAFSALHLAYLLPEQYRKYTLTASHHQSIALQGTRQGLSNITPENCHALFGASSLVFIGALAAGRPNPDNPDGPTLESLVDVFYLSKGIGGLLNNSENALRNGPFGPFFIITATGVTSPVLDCVSAQIDKYLVRVMDMSREDPVRMIIESEIASLSICIKRAMVSTRSPEYRIIASWPNLMTDKFISLLRQRHPAALGLLSHFCVIMYATEPGYWFTRGWSLRIIQDISRSMTAPWDQDSVWALDWITGHSGMTPSLPGIVQSTC
jgi:hypothetical protein